jgi:hypothetical protein
LLAAGAFYLNLLLAMNTLNWRRREFVVAQLDKINSSRGACNAQLMLTYEVREIPLWSEDAPDPG